MAPRAAEQDRRLQRAGEVDLVRRVRRDERAEETGEDEQRQDAPGEPWTAAPARKRPGDLFGGGVERLLGDRVKRYWQHHGWTSSLAGRAVRRRRQRGTGASRRWRCSPARRPGPRCSRVS